MISPLETTILGVMMMAIMFGMGASMTWRDFLRAFRRPRGVFVGLASQFAIMPALGFAIAMALQLPPALMVGLILVSCMPGGTTSNIFAYFSRGVLALSIMMTTASTMVAVIMVPVLLSFYSGLAGLGADYVIPTGNVAQVLGVLLVPTVLGMALRKWNPNAGATAELVGALMGVVVILFLIATWIPRNWQLLVETDPGLYAAAIGIGLAGMTFGYAVARLLRQNKSRARTISLETGIQNAPLAALIVTLTFAGEVQQAVLIIPVLYGVFIVFSATIVTIWFRRSARREELARDAAKLRT